MAENQELQEVMDRAGLEHLWSRLKQKLEAKAPTQFVMTLTYDTTGGNNHSLDKTFAELEAAYQAGSQIRLVDTSGMEYELLAFAAGYMAYFAHHLNADRYLIGIRANNTITYTSTTPFTTSNPPTAAQVGAKASNNNALATGSIKTWALNQTISMSIGVQRNVTDMPLTGAYWIADLTVATSGMWRKLVVTKADSGGTAPVTYEATCMSGTWSAWTIVATSKPSFVTATMAASGWSGNTYSFESTYPKASYDIAIEVAPTATVEQFEAFGEAMICGSATENVATALNGAPSMDIPIIVKVVAK